MDDGRYRSEVRRRVENNKRLKVVMRLKNG